MLFKFATDGLLVTLITWYDMLRRNSRPTFSHLQTLLITLLLNDLMPHPRHPLKIPDIIIQNLRLQRLRMQLLPLDLLHIQRPSPQRVHLAGHEKHRLGRRGQALIDAPRHDLERSVPILVVENLPLDVVVAVAFKYLIREAGERGVRGGVVGALAAVVVVRGPVEDVEGAEVEAADEGVDVAVEGVVGFAGVVEEAREEERAVWEGEAEFLQGGAGLAEGLQGALRVAGVDVSPGRLGGRWWATLGCGERVFFWGFLCYVDEEFLEMVAVLSNGVGVRESHGVSEADFQRVEFGGLSCQKLFERSQRPVCLIRNVVHQLQRLQSAMGTTSGIHMEEEDVRVFAILQAQLFQVS